MENAISKYQEIIANHPDLVYNEGVPIKIVIDEKEILEWVNQQKVNFRNDDKPEDWAHIGLILKRSLYYSSSRPSGISRRTKRRLL